MIVTGGKCYHMEGWLTALVERLRTKHSQKWTVLRSANLHFDTVEGASRFECVPSISSLPCLYVVYIYVLASFAAEPVFRYGGSIPALRLPPVE